MIGAPVHPVTQNRIEHVRERASADLMTQVELRHEISKALTTAMQAFDYGDYAYAEEHARLAADLFRKVGVIPDYVEGAR